MQACFKKSGSAIPVDVLKKEKFKSWLKRQNSRVRNIVASCQDGSTYFITNTSGKLAQVIFVFQDGNVAEFAKLAESLPKGVYRLKGLTKSQHQEAAFAWGLASYRFDDYKKKQTLQGKLLLPASLDQKLLSHTLESIYLVRDLINIPANDLMPKQLATKVKKLATKLKAQCKVISGKALLQKNFPAIYTVGQASDHESQLIDLRWGKKSHPKLTLVGKGVCYDTGGLSLKPTQYMLNMKKDMGGAAHVLGLANLIIQQKLPVNLRVLIPAVDNAIGSNAYRPGDVMTMRNGLTVEVTNTDAEGRLVLADAMSLAVEDKPDLMIDFATLTGAARVALGTDVPAMFSNQQDIATKLQLVSQKQQDLLWHMPLHQAYQSLLKSEVADCVNSEPGSYGGAITAALFLAQFVADTPWVHIDLMAWNTASKPGRPKGGEAMGLRAVFEFIREWC